MESFQKRARERRKREKKAEKQARRDDRGAGRPPSAHDDGPTVPVPHLPSTPTPRTDVAPAARPQPEIHPT